MELEKILEKLGIDHYDITSEGININQNFQIPNNISLKKIPIKINICFGDFNLVRNDLITLENCPNEIYGDFNCGWNKLTSLENGPLIVHGDYYCYDNLLKTNFSNTIVKGRFHTTLKEDGLDFINQSYVATNYEFWLKNEKRKRILNKIKNNHV